MQNVRRRMPRHHRVEVSSAPFLHSFGVFAQVPKGRYCAVPPADVDLFLEFCIAFVGHRLMDAESEGLKCLCISHSRSIEHYLKHAKGSSLQRS